MIVRKLDENGDFTFGRGRSDFLKDSPEAVAQCVKTRLALWQGQWFNDLDEGTPWIQSVLGKKQAIELVVRSRILETDGVTEILSFVTVLDSDSRAVTATATIRTRYGDVTITESIK